MKKNKIKNATVKTAEALADLKEALELLQQTKAGKEKDLLADGAVKRFESLFEYCWKTLKIFVEYQGGEAPGPRPAIQEAIRFGWIKNPEFWASALDTRNATVHDYFDAAPKNYMEIIKKYADEVERVIQILNKIKIGEI